MQLSVTVLSIFMLMLPICSLSQDPTISSTERSGVRLEPIGLGDHSINFRHSTPPVLLIEYEAGGHSVISINGVSHDIDLANGRGEIPLRLEESGSLHLISIGSNTGLFHLSRSDSGYRFKKIPLWLSVLPPLVAIIMALIFKEVLISLFVGVWMGAFIAGGMRIDSLHNIFLPIVQTVSHYVVNALADTGHLAVIIFTLLIGGMVAIVSRNGGMAGVVQQLSAYARSPRSSQLVTWLLGVAIFFDDYANTLIVGNTMRSITDKFKVSREKLAYIVDSTAAPVAAVAFITTWIGAELGYIDGGMSGLANFPFNLTPYAIFVASLKYSFYPILTLAFILTLIYLKRDYGPMYSAEVRAHTTGRVKPVSAAGAQKVADLDEFKPVESAPLRWYNAAIPVVVVIVMTIFGLLQTGFEAIYNKFVDSGYAVTGRSWGAVWSQMGLLASEGENSLFLKIGQVIGSADSYTALLWSSVTGVIVAVIMSISQKILSLKSSMHFLAKGFETMLPGVLILTLAWALAITTQELHTADYLTGLLTGNVNAYAMPGLVFVMSAFIAFSTGSSWSTMAILYPIAIPTTWAVCMAGGMGMDVSLEILLNVISTVLAASVLGDHCSPISDTTILSSLASQCNHIDHVRTQLPYALTVGVVSLIAGTVSTLLGGGWLISFFLLVISLALLAGVILRFGKNARLT